MERLDKFPLSDAAQTNDEETSTGDSGAAQPAWAQAWGGRAPESLFSPGQLSLGDDITGAPLIDSLRASITLDGFASDSSELTSAHLDALAAYRKRVQRLLQRYPDPLNAIVGHTDATASEAHNEAL